MTSMKRNCRKLVRSERHLHCHKCDSRAIRMHDHGQGDCSVCAVHDPCLVSKPSGALAREASASCSLDGETRHCEACLAPEHCCGKRPMTAAELELVDAALAAHESMLSPVSLFRCVEAVRAERAKERK